MIILQLGAGPEIVAALDAGRIAAAALTTRYAIPVLTARLAGAGRSEHD
jgi:hypothetical protein